jgi:hypothetical protein
VKSDVEKPYIMTLMLILRHEGRLEMQVHENGKSFRRV